MLSGETPSLPFPFPPLSSPMPSLSTLCRLNNSMTHADLTGYPSEQDLHDIAAYGSGSLKHPDDETISSKGSGVQMRLPIGIPKGRGKSSAKN
jgi:hypothetical protein